MLTARRCGGTDARSWPSSSTRPSSGISRPASSRNSVVLPQPEGPSSAKNSPWKMSSDKAATAPTPEKLLLTASNRTSGGAFGSLRDADVRGKPPWCSAGLVLVSARLVMRGTLEHFQEKWRPVFRPKIRQCKNAGAFSAALETEKEGGSLSVASRCG